MNKLPLIALWCLLIHPVPSLASGNPEAAAVDTETDLWSRTRETADDWWQRSREATEDAWRDTRESAGEAWQETRELFEHKEQDSFGDVWDRVLPTLKDTLTLQERQSELPESKWLGADQASNREAINELLDEAVDILSTSPVQSYRDRIRVLQVAIAQMKAEIADDRQRRVSAPEESVVKKTVEDYDQAIAERLADIRRYEQELAQIKQELAADLRSMGLDLSDEQLELLLSTVVGDNLVDLTVVFDNVKAVTAQLEQLVEASGEDLQSARRYYGMYVVLLKSLNQMHLQIEQAIAEQYIPQIDAIIRRAGELSADTKALQQQSPEKRELLAANLEAQQLTIQAADVYRQYLTDQSKQVRKARQALEKDIAAAWNTYETVRVSGELVSLVQSSSRLLDGLLNRQVPALRPFQNLEMKREFEKLTAQLRSAQAS
ncbi:MAG: hypothetical protein U9Q81_03950 [Pseudomonadota bacterium]|nr:hypothetical protein [Pseudomonadota bacterium]